MKSVRLLFIPAFSFLLQFYAYAADPTRPPHPQVSDFLMQGDEEQATDTTAGLDATDLMLLAAAQGNVALGDALIRVGLDPNAATAEGISPLYQALVNHQWPFIELLQRNNVDINAPLPNGFTPIRFATRFGHIDMARLLLTFLGPASLHERDADGNTLIHDAAQGPDPRGLILFFLHHLPLNAINAVGRTPLHLAVLHGNVAGIRLLRALGANVMAADNGGRTPMQLARTIHNAAAQHALTEMLDVALILRPYRQFIIENAQQIEVTPHLSETCMDEPIKRRQSDEHDDDNNRGDKRARLAPAHPIAAWGPPVS